MCWEYVSQRWLDIKDYKGKVKFTHANFSLFPKIDVYMTIQNISLKPIGDLLDTSINIFYN